MTPQPPAAIPASDWETSKGLRFVTEESTGLNRFVICDEVVVASAAANADLPTKIPANSVVDGLIVTTPNGVTLVTGTHTGVGTSGDPDLFAEIASASLNAAGETVYDTAIAAAPVAVASETTVRIASTNGSGAAAGTLAGTVRVWITGRTYNRVAV